MYATTPPVLSTITETSLKIRRAVSTIYSDLNRNPLSLPPKLNIPGSSKVLFVNVDLWLINLINNQGIIVPDVKKEDVVIQPASAKKKRGRPSNAAKMAVTGDAE